MNTFSSCKILPFNVFLNNQLVEDAKKKNLFYSILSQYCESWNIFKHNC